MAPQELLMKAADLIEPPGRWVQGALAGDRNGRPLQDAVTGADFCGHCWCVLGAIDKVMWNVRCVDKLDVPYSVRDAAKQILADHLGRNPAAWNDAEGRTQTEAVEALRSAAA